MLQLIRFIHLLSITVWVGGIVFFSFIAAPAIFKVLPRETAGDVVGEIFPKYWILGYVCSLLSITSLLLISKIEGHFQLAATGILVVMTILTFYTGLVVGGKARQIKQEIRAAAEGTEKAALRKEFGSLHFRSVILNGIILILGVVYVFVVASYAKS